MRRGGSTEIIYKRISSSIDIIIKGGDLKEKSIVIFGCTMWAKMLIGLLADRGLKVAAFVDNNPKKTGGKCQGIDVYSPNEYLMNAQDKYIVIICSSYWREMSRQLESMGYRRDNNFFVIFYEDEVGHFWRNLKEVITGYRLYHKLLRKYPVEGKHVFVCPYGASGDVYMAGLFFKTYRQQQGIEKYLLIVDNRLAERTAKMFDIDPIVVVSEEEKKALLHAWSFFGSVCIPVKPLLYWGWRTKKFPNPDANMDITFLDMMKYDVYNFEEVVTPQPPKQMRKDFCSAYFKENKLMPGKTVILAPYAGSFSTSITAEFWQCLAKHLVERGYLVCTNSAGDNEPVIPGTTPIFFPLDCTVDMLNMAGYFIGVRSGFCDIASNSHCRFIVLYERALNAVKYEFFSFKRMGLQPKALEFIYDDEDKEAFIEQILEAVG